jgi:hypothetical protein
MSSFGIFDTHGLEFLYQEDPDKMLDEALQLTFPASDPVSLQLEGTGRFNKFVGGDEQDR